MQVRDAVPGDAPGIAALAREAWHAAYGDLLSSEAIDATVDEWYDEAALRRSIRGDGVFLVCETDEGVDRGETDESDDRGDEDDPVLLGFAHADYSESVGNVVLRRIYVRPDAWDEGVGTRLVRTVARGFLDADDLDYERLSAVVLADNEVGRAFYDSLAFEEVGRQTTTIGGEAREERIVAANLAALADSSAE